jgi:alpha-glucan,water dikinase
VLRFPKDRVPPFLVFDLFSPQTNRWENNHGKDYWVALRESGPAPLTALDRAVSSVPGSETVQKRSWALDGGGDLAVAIRRGEQQTEVILASNLDGPLDLHWGIQDRARSAWKQPTVGHWPEGTVAFDEQAVRSRFLEREGLRWLTLRFPVGEEPPGIGFVLFQPESGRWAKHRGTDLFLRLAAAETPGVPLSDLMSAIVEGEMGPHGWTLMHRFNLCHDLIEEAGDNREAWATLFVWLRYSAIRQLDWQRNYNTKPRELAHAQDRLTARLAESYIRHPAQRDLIRLMLACVGRGGEGQRIRDDILHIMHRHHIKEVGGTWMEQWHQKLHNNTTPDDIVICQAYLAFLRGNGDLHAYDAVLLEGGVTRERLAGFERPITRDPEWHPQLKDGLIHDFENYLQLLRSVHAGTDLDTAAQAGGRLIEGRAFEALTFVQHRFRDPQVDAVELTTRITEARRGLVAGLGRMSDAAGVKDGLYLDLALEEALRTAIERQLQSKFGSHQLVALLGLVLDNLLLVEANVELDQCNREWRRLPLDQRFSRDWCLRAKAVVDRLRRAVEAVTDGTYQRLQPLAERLGGEFQAAPWTVTLFSEEIVRGRPLFLLSMLLHQLDPVLRKEAKLGDWQVISPSRVAGVVRVVAELRAVQGRKFDRPTVLVADVVRGDEEPPEGVRAVITPKSVDLVSHVAVRARNAGLLFATCFEDRIFKQLRELEGQHIELAVTGSGDVTFSKSEAVETAPARRRGVGPRSVQRPVPALRVLRRAEFEPGQVGGKSWRIRELAERVPEAFRTPRSVALPFGVFDAVLADPDNRESARQFQSLRAIVDSAPEARLPELRACILGLRVPQRLLDEIRVALRDEGVAVSADTDAMSQRIKQVWASLWNERAYFSRQANGLPHDSVSMAVLIQEVVEAQYAFVIHTVNPATSNREELYAEVVCGLGETLVGNHPGRALSFVVNKSTLQSTLLAYPSKSLGLRGGGLIFRSDSNAEDLEGYAGAGLYDSVLLVPAVEQVLDYTTDPLVWDSAFQAQFFRGIARAGMAVEQAFGGSQDVEGAWVGGTLHVVQTRPQVGSV